MALSRDILFYGLFISYDLRHYFKFFYMILLAFSSTFMIPIDFQTTSRRLQILVLCCCRCRRRRQYRLFIQKIVFQNSLGFHMVPYLGSLFWFLILVPYSDSLFRFLIMVSYMGSLLEFLIQIPYQASLENLEVWVLLAMSFVLVVLETERVFSLVLVVICKFSHQIQSLTLCSLL